MDKVRKRNLKNINDIYCPINLFSEGQENVVHQFEDIGIPTTFKYSGRHLIRVRPDNNFDN